MAWPATSLTAYVSNTVPAIKAFDLNAFQSGITGIINGIYSHKAVSIDSIGGALVAPPIGSLQLTTSNSSTLTPNPTQAVGTFFRDQIPSAWVNVTSAGTIIKGVNAKLVTRMGPGVYIVDFNVSLGPSLPAGALAASAAIIGGAPAFICYVVNVATPTKITVRTYDGSTALAADFSFSLVVYSSN